MKNKRRGATPIARDNAEKDHILLVAGWSFIAGCMLVATIAVMFYG
jgi:hypothetical protein